MSLRDVHIFENEVLGDDVATGAKKTAMPLVGSRFQGEAQGSIQTSTDHQTMSTAESFKKLLAKTGLQAAPPSPPVRRGNVTMNSNSKDVYAELLRLERQLATLEADTAIHHVPTELVITDVERILEEHSTEQTRTARRRALEILHERLEQVLVLARRNRPACMQSVDSDTEMLLDATTTLLSVQRMGPVSLSLVQDLTKIDQMQSGWLQLKKELSECVKADEVDEFSKKLDALEGFVEDIEERFEPFKQETLQQLASFEEELVAKLGLVVDADEVEEAEDNNIKITEETVALKAHPGSARKEEEELW